MTMLNTETLPDAVGAQVQRGVRRAASAALDAYFFLAWWFSGALLCWLPLAFVAADMARGEMTLCGAVRFEYRIFWRTLRDDRPRA